MCRLSGRHSDIFYCWANCCQHGSRPLVPSISGPYNSCGSLDSVPQIEKRPWSHGGCLVSSLLPKIASRRARGTNLGEVWRSRHAKTAIAQCEQHSTGEMCGRQAPRGRKVWTHESATLAPDSRRIVAFVSLGHDIRAADRSLEPLESIVSKE